MAGHPIDRAGDEPESSTRDGTPIVMRVGFLAAGGVIAALISSLTAAFRTGDEPFTIGRPLEQWLVLSAVATPFSIAAVAVLRRARVGLQLLAGERGSLFVMGFLWWSVVELALLSIFAAVLRKTTHHNALAGVTFAMFALVTGVVVALFAARVTKMVANVLGNTRRHALVIAAGCVVVALVLALIRTSRAEGMHAAAGIVDAISFFVAASITSSRLLKRTRLVAIAGLPAAFLLIMVGLTTLRFDPKLAQSLAGTAPIHAFVIGLFGP
jgi:hypothetical protein